MNVLVVGGAGYIGSHLVHELAKTGHTPFVLDNLRTGHRNLVHHTPLIEGDMSNESLVYNILTSKRIDVVMHFAAFSQVGESVKKPSEYYQNNVIHTKNLLDTMIKANVKHLIFSSSAATYGNPKEIPIREHHPTQPINPYGHTKLAIEWMLEDYHRAYFFNSVSLRYFNAAGASISIPIGEDHNPETHLIPRILLTALGHFPQLEIFGKDYPTPDGTCVRDYIHVEDLASAHVKAMGYLKEFPGSHIFNLGIGKGFSVMEVVRASLQVTGLDIPFVIKERREGDPPELVANADKIRKAMDWRPQFTELKPIIASAWELHKKRHSKYG